MHARIAIFVAIGATVAATLAALVGLDGSLRWIAGGCGVVLLLLQLWVLRSTVLPVSRIISGMDLLMAQDFASRLRPVGQRDADRLSALFNMMMDALHRERSRVLEQNHYLGLLVESSPMGVVNFDHSGRLTAINPSGMAMLGVADAEALKGRRLAELAPLLPDGLAGIADGETITLRPGGTSIVGATMSHFIERGVQVPFLTLVRLDDEMRRAERRGFTTAIRTMAHEVRNSFGAVDSALQTLTEIVDTAAIDADERADAIELIASSRSRMEGATNFISSFAALARLPEPEMEVADMADIVARVAPAVRPLCDHHDISLTILAPRGAFIGRMDANQMEQVLVNLIKNAAESIAASGRPDGAITIEVTRTGVKVTDNGTGISPDDAAAALINPFFTTKPDGQGIGLTLSTEIIRSHRWRPSLATDPATGLTTFAITRG